MVKIALFETKESTRLTFVESFEIAHLIFFFSSAEVLHLGIGLYRIDTLQTPQFTLVIDFSFLSPGYQNKTSLR